MFLDGFFERMAQKTQDPLAHQIQVQGSIWTQDLIIIPEKANCNQHDRDGVRSMGETCINQQSELIVDTHK